MADELDNGTLGDLLPRPEDDELGHVLLRDRAKARLFGATPAPNIGRFEIERRLGRGGMGEVFLARDPELRRPVAIKLVHATLLAEADSRGRERVLREAQALAQVSHPNVIEVFEVGEHEGRPFVAMEYVEGRTLEQWIHEEQPGWAEIVAVFLEAGRGLTAVHRAGLIHRDFKPDNVLISFVDGERRVRVLDFGLARLGCGEITELGATEPDLELTAAGAILGTPAFMPLEQLRGEPATEASDQFAFCVALYRALWGCEPFDGSSVEARIEQLEQLDAREPPPRAREPRRLWPIVARGLARQPEDRWPDLPTLLAELECIVNPRRRWPWLAVVAFGLAVGTGLALHGEQPPPAADAEVDTCAPLSAKAEALWDPVRAAATEAEYAASGPAYAAHTFTRVDASMRNWSAAWLELRSRTCVAARASAVDPLELRRLERRARCLDELYVEAEAVSRVLRHVDAMTVSRALELVDLLPPLEPCTDDAHLEQGAARPSGALRAQVEAARGALAELRARRRSGHTIAASAGLVELQDDVATLDYPPLQAELASEAAKLELARSRRIDGLERLAEAAVLAERARLDRLAAADWTVLALQAVIVQRDAERGRRWLERAEVAAARLGQPPELDARLQCIHGALAGLEGDPELAREQLDEALAKLEGEALAPAGPHLWTPTCLEARARVDRDEGQALARLERAYAVAEQVYGPEHPQLEGFRIALAAEKQRLGKLDDELDASALDPIVEALDAHHLDDARRLIDGFEAELAETGARDPDFAQLDLLRGSLAFEAGNYSTALAHFDAARDRLDSDPQMQPYLVEIDFNRGTCVFALGELERAQVLFAGYVDAAPEGPSAAEAHAILAQIALADARLDEVSAHLERARALVGDDPSERFDVILTELLLDLRARPGEPPGCEELRGRLDAAVRGIDEAEQTLRIELTLAAIDASARERRCLGWPASSDSL